jgi:hypothetical protein
MNTGYVRGPVSPYLRRPTRSLEMVLAQRFEIPIPTEEAGETERADAWNTDRPQTKRDDR